MDTPREQASPANMTHGPQPNMETNTYYSRDRREMLQFLPATFSDVIEIGCGQGEFGRLVKAARQTRYSAIEADAAAASVARSHLDYVLVGDAVAAVEALPDHRFDLLVCNDVIEHLAAPEKLLQSIRPKMKPHAALVCSLPNVRVLGNLIHLLVHKDFEYTDWGIRDRTHLRFFTKKSMVRFFEDNGLRIERIAGINPITSPKTSAPLALLQLLGHGDTRFMQFGITARF